ALRGVDLDAARGPDVGTGSAILAIAAARLGAAHAIGIDSDPDAIQAANENRARNGDEQAVEFAVADLTDSGLPAAHVIVANLTGALLVRAAPALARAVRPGGTLIVSGLLTEEREAVCAAL